jgi:AraC-like ligand binding domain
LSDVSLVRRHMEPECGRRLGFGIRDRHVLYTAHVYREPLFWRDQALPFIEARSVWDGRKVCYAKHWHESFSIGLIAKGRCSYMNGRKVKEVSAGTVVSMNPGDVHACNPIRGEHWSYRMLYIDVAWLCKTQGVASGDRGHGFAPFSAMATTQAVLYDGLSRLLTTLTNSAVAHLEKQTATVSFIELLRNCIDQSRSTHLARSPRLTIDTGIQRGLRSRPPRLNYLPRAGDSRSFSHLATTAVAMPLPMTFVIVRPMSSS